MSNQGANAPDPVVDYVVDVRELEQEAEGRYRPFAFLGLDGETRYELPNPQLMSPDDIRRALKVPDREAESFNLDAWAPDAIARAIAPEAWREVRKLKGYTQGKLMAAWVEHCELDLDEGKEPSGPSAINRQQRRSKRT